MVPGFLPPTMDERQFSGASDHSDSEAPRTFAGRGYQHAHVPEHAADFDAPEHVVRVLWHCTNPGPLDALIPTRQHEDTQRCGKAAVYGPLLASVGSVLTRCVCCQAARSSR